MRNKKSKIAGIIKEFGLWGIVIVFFASIPLLIIEIQKYPKEQKFPKEQTEIVVKEAIVVEKSLRIYNFFYNCEITDAKSNEIFIKRAENKESAKMACNLFEENESYTIFFKTKFDNNYVVIE